jgi:CubicO group peptidase (beta-lactamase class C family)
MLYLRQISLLLTSYLVLFSCTSSNTEKASQDQTFIEIDSLVESVLPHAFNGIIVLSKGDSILYHKERGYADIEQKDTLNLKHQFVIGSISKQITAVLILQAYEDSLLQLETPIAQYLPELTMSWKDSINIHHLLTHKHGIQALDKALLFHAGNQFQYSQLGYELLAQILEEVHQQSFVDISSSLFQEHGLKNTFHPQNKAYRNLVKGYTENENGKLLYETQSFQNYVPAGAFISTAQDLIKWNLLLHHGKLLKAKTFQLMTIKQATRQHPIFNAIDYGYGLTFKANEQNFQIGALGFAPGFVSSNFYFPMQNISVVVLENVAANLPDFRQTFHYHTSIIHLSKEALNIKQ